MHLDNPYQERRRLLWLSLLSLLSLLFTAQLLSSCRPKPQPVQSPTIIYGDTTRIKLVHRANASADSLIIVHLRNQSTVTSYEQTAQQFDSIKVALP